MLAAAPLNADENCVLDSFEWRCSDIRVIYLPCATVSALCMFACEYTDTC